MKEYTFGEFVFEFEWKKDLKGHLRASTREETFSADINLGDRKNRKEFVEEVGELYGEEFQEFALRRALNELTTAVGEDVAAMKAAASEAEKDGDDSGADDVVPPPDEGTERYEAAMEILESEDVLERAAGTMRHLGHIGEWSNKKLAFACAISARAQLPVQPSTHAQSSAGKNYLWDTALALVPPELVYKRTGFSAKALFRTKMSLKHSVLYIQELAGSEGADFSIRTLQSDNVLTWEATEKASDGSLETVVYEVEGPTVIVQTTTKNHLHPENETRVVPLYLDESAEQTARITADAKRRAAGIGSITAAERDEMTAVWHDAVRLLEPAEMVIPFAERIEVPSAPLRLRRDVPRLINVIKLVAWVHQHTRDRDDAGRILATEDDFAMAIDMVGDSFARAWKSLTPSEEKVYTACKRLTENLRKHGFKRSHVESALAKVKEKVPHSTVKDCLRELSSSGYLESDGRKGAAGATYTMVSTEEGSGTITLAAHSSIKENDEETPAKEDILMDESESVHSRPLSIPDDKGAVGDGERLMDENGRNGFRPLKRADLQGKHGNGRMDDEDPRRKVNYEYEVVTEEE